MPHKARHGVSIAKVAKEQLEKKLGRAVVSPLNAKGLKEVELDAPPRLPE